MTTQLLIGRPSRRLIARNHDTELYVEIRCDPAQTRLQVGIIGAKDQTVGVLSHGIAVHFNRQEHIGLLFFQPPDIDPVELIRAGSGERARRRRRLRRIVTLDDLNTLTVQMQQGIVVDILRRSYWIPGSFETRSSMSAPSNALPRFRTL